MIQLAIALFGLTALVFAMGKHPGRRKWAPIIGLMGQPFWFMATVPTAQWGMVALCCAYTVVYMHGIITHWRSQ